MPKRYYLIATIAILSLFFSSQEADAQYFKPGKMKNDSPIELDGSVTAPKMHSNQANYDSKYKPPDWWVEGWKWAKWISRLLFGNNQQPSWNNAVASSYPHGPAIGDIPAEYPGSYLPGTKSIPRGAFSIGVGVGIGEKGGKDSYGGKVSILYVQVPAVMVQYNYPLPAGGEIFGGIGPYYAVALSGRYKDETISQSLKFGNDKTDDFRRGDFGLKFRAGYALPSSPVLIAFTADFGLRNLQPGGDKVVKIKNQVLGLQVGYLFGKH